MRRLGKLGNRSQHRVPPPVQQPGASVPVPVSTQGVARVSCSTGQPVCRILHRPNEQRNRSCPPSRQQPQTRTPASATRRLLRLPRRSHVDKGTMPDRRSGAAARGIQEAVVRVGKTRALAEAADAQIWRADAFRRPLPSSAERWAFKIGTT